VKSRLLHAAIAASLFAPLPAVLAEEAKPPVHSELFEATVAAMTELQAADNAKLGITARLERMEQFRHSPETAARLLKVYGSERPFSFTRVPTPDGQVGFRVALMPLKYTGQDGAKAEWTEASGNIVLDKSGRNLTIDGSWSSLNFEDQQARMAVRDITLAGKQHQGYGGLWFGDAQVGIASVVVEPKTPAAAAGPAMTLEGMRVNTIFAELPKTAEIGYQLGIKGLAVAGQRIDDLRIALRITNLDKQAMLKMKAASEKNKGRLAGLTSEQQMALVQPMIKEFARAAVMRGAAIELDDFSAGYGGNRASIKGRLSFQGVNPADLDSIPALLKKLVGRFDVKVPLALVREVAGGVARQQLAAQHGGTADPQAVAQMAQTITDVIVGKLINGGFARVENEVIVSTIELRGGKLLANGKEIELPKPQPAPGAPVSSVDQFLQARRIDASCRLPDYPAEVITQDAPLKLTLRFVVGTDGHLSQVAVAEASNWPAYDQAAVAAAASCTYVPALSKGKPVAVPMRWKVAREAGTLHP
jgi:TonB family protein